MKVLFLFSRIVFAIAVLLGLAGCRGAPSPDLTAAPTAGMMDAAAAEQAAVRMAQTSHRTCVDAPEVLGSEYLAALNAHQRLGLPADDYQPGGLDVCEMVWLVTLRCTLELTPPGGQPQGAPEPGCLYVILPDDAAAARELGSMACP